MWYLGSCLTVNGLCLRCSTKRNSKFLPLVLFSEVLDHVMRIDRIFRQPQGHLLLIGVSDMGETYRSRFVAWVNSLSIFQIKVHNKYLAEDFDKDLRSDCKNEKIAFILDEWNVFDSSFFKRMNTLLAYGEVLRLL